MTRPTLLVLIGTKAQFIKTAPILREMDARGVHYRLVYTGQHCETFGLLEAAFGTRPPDEILVSAFEAATPSSFANWCLRYWSAVTLRIFRGAWRGTKLGLVHGDTASTLFGALAIRLSGGVVAHVEAGLRSPRVFEPFPEEIVRRWVSRLSQLHFAPDAHAVTNLGGVQGLVIDTHGNSLRDALIMALAKLGRLPSEGGSGGYAVVSVHRSENLSSRSTFKLLMETVLETSGVLPTKFVLHPATRARIQSSEWGDRLRQAPSLELLDRMDYPNFIQLLLGSRFLMTDGGSNQEEAAMLGLPTLLLRRATERPDGLGDNVELSGLQTNVIREFVANHSSTAWTLRLLEGSSPSKEIVEKLVEVQRDLG